MHAFQATQKSFRYVILTACWSCAAYTLSSVTLLHSVCRHDAGVAVAFTVKGSWPPPHWPSVSLLPASPTQMPVSFVPAKLPVLTSSGSALEPVKTLIPCLTKSHGPESAVQHVKPVLCCCSLCAKIAPPMASHRAPTSTTVTTNRQDFVTCIFQEPRPTAGTARSR